MAKPQSFYSCNACGSVQSRWAGQCPACGEWNTLVEEAIDAKPKSMQFKKGKGVERVALSAAGDDTPRTLTGIGELDRVLGGGLVAGSAVLVGGDPGIGKSTLLLQMAHKLAMGGHSCWMVSGEESIRQISLRAKRLGVSNEQVGDNLQLSASGQLRDILATLEGPDAPAVLIIDSIQTMYLDSLDAAPGTVSQVRACANELIRATKKRHTALILVGHVTKDGQIAGPRVLEHMVDSVLYFEGERGHNYRILRGVKNRFGGTDEIGVFEMADSGLREVNNPSSLFLSDRKQDVSGCVVFAGMEGSRPLLVEIQALVAPSVMATPRRAVVGWDQNRLAMLLAVLEARGGVRLSDKEVYLNVTGGFKVNEPAADLAVAAAIVSAMLDKPISPDTVLFGEIGLSGEIRPVAHMDRRAREAAKLGFHHAIMPPVTKGSSTGIATREVEDIHSLLTALEQPAKWKASA
ncbi:DNA repair protein RadA [bacterium]|nr:DNA repair protein RadA [bacterium]